MTLNELPEIKIVHHARAIRLRLRVEPTQIRLTAPLFCSKKQIQNFIAQSEQWLVKTWQEQQQQREIEVQNRVLPTELRLFNLEQAVQITYQAQQKRFVFDHENLQLVISDRQPEQYLKAFVIAYAKHYLPLYLAQVSTETGLSFAQCTIRQPKTRWGSCTSKHDIMLNGALVLFPKEAVRYVCVHELAHTRYFDHSPQFWMQVQLHDHNFQQHQKILKTKPLHCWWFFSNH